jgi:hypothetical protein
LSHTFDGYIPGKIPMVGANSHFVILVNIILDKKYLFKQSVLCFYPDFFRAEKFDGKGV